MYIFEVCNYNGLILIDIYFKFCGYFLIYYKIELWEVILSGKKVILNIVFCILVVRFL